MSLEDEIKALRVKRETEKQVRLTEERGELVVQLTPDSIAQKLAQLKIEKPASAEAVSLLQGLNVPVLFSEIAGYFGLSPAVMEPPPSVVLGLLGRETKWSSPLGRIIRKERDIPKIEIYTGEEGEKPTYVSIGCVQSIREVTLLGGQEFPKDHTRGVTIVAVPQESSWKIRVGGLELEPREDLLRDTIVAMLADLDI